MNSNSNIEDASIEPKRETLFKLKNKQKYLLEKKKTCVPILLLIIRKNKLVKKIRSSYNYFAISLDKEIEEIKSNFASIEGVLQNLFNAFASKYNYKEKLVEQVDINLIKPKKKIPIYFTIRYEIKHIEEALENVKKSFKEYVDLGIEAEYKYNIELKSLAGIIGELIKHIYTKLEELKRKVANIEKKILPSLRSMQFNNDLKRYKEELKKKINDALPNIKKSYLKIEKSSKEEILVIRKSLIELFLMNFVNNMVEKDLGLTPNAELSTIQQEIQKIDDSIEISNQKIEAALLCTKLSFVEYLEELFRNLNMEKNTHFKALFRSNHLNNFFLIVLIIIFMVLWNFFVYLLLI